MRRIFTLFSLFTFIVCIKGFSQNCATTQPNPAICSGNVAEDFNSSDEGFVATNVSPATGSFNYSSGGFSRTVPGNAPQTGVATITSHNYTKTANQPGAIQTGFQISGSKITINTVTIDILNANTNAVVASCTQTINLADPNNATVCMGVFSNNITEGLKVKIRFTINTTNTGTGAGGHSFAFDNFSIGDLSNAALPVDFISFTGKKTSSGTELNWQVGVEDNVKGYEVEKSSDGVQYTKVGFVSAAGKTSYFFTDVTPSPNVVLYRIKNVDLDGKFKYSNVLRMSNGNYGIVLKAFPLPALSKTTVQHPSVIGSNARISVNLTDGRLVKSVTPSTGSSQTTIDVSDLKSGLYLLRFDDGKGDVQTIKLLKQ